MINFNFLNCLLTWEKEDITPNSFSIKLVEIVKNSEDWNKSANILTGFNNFVTYIDIFVYFSFCWILHRLFEYYSIRLWLF